MRTTTWTRISGGLFFTTFTIASVLGCSASAPAPAESPEGVTDKGAVTAAPTASAPTTIASAIPSAVPSAAPTGVASAPAQTPPASGGCKADSDCATGQSCNFSQGCDTGGVCGPPRMCTKDLVPYCGCDGTEFRGSGTCPSRPFRHRGKC